MVCMCILMVCVCEISECMQLIGLGLLIWNSVVAVVVVAAEAFSVKLSFRKTF